MIKKIWSNPEKRKRLWEILPGVLTWNVILFPLWGAFVVPQVVAYFMIAFLVYWMYRSFKSALLAVLGYYKIRAAEKTNWRKKFARDYKKGWLKWKEVGHVIIIASYKEPILVIEELVESLAKQKQIDLKSLSVILAQEKRAGEENNRKTEAYFKKKYEGIFGRLMFTEHPPDLPGEIKGKASNETWAAKEFTKEVIKKIGLDMKKLTLTTTDVDTVFHPLYFAALTYHFCRDEDRYIRFWQAPLLWHTNIRRVPAPIRVVGVMGNMMHVGDVQEPDGLIFNYSCYSSSYRLIDSVGYWDTNIIPEDWHIFLQTFFGTGGQVEVKALFLPNRVGAPDGESYVAALKNRYSQTVRHAWGATDISYMIENSIEHKEIPWLRKLPRIYRLFKTHLIWSSNWFILTLGASLPVTLNREFFQTTIGFNLPRFSQTILTICLLPLFVLIVLDWKLRPEEVRPKGIKEIFFNIVQWPLMPLATLFMAALPGLDSHTKLMMGKRIDYVTTKKKA